MGTVFDIRRSVRNDAEYLGKDIAEAIRKIAEEQKGHYVQNKLFDLDGESIELVGIRSRSPLPDFILVTGEKLENVGIVLDKTYNKIGVRSYELRPSNEYALFSSERTIKEVEKVRGRLEELLK